MNDLETIASGCFPTTQWTQIIDVIQRGDDAAAWEALSEFCGRYRPAIYNFFRRRGCPPERAEDYTQSFFAERIIAIWPDRKSFLHSAERRGPRKFRGFLSWMLWNFLKDQIKAATSQKAGGQKSHVSLNDLLPSEEVGDDRAFERFGREFDRGFALEIIQKAAARAKHSKYLEAHLRGEVSQQVAAKAMGISENAFKAAYHRFRERLRQNLWEEVSKLTGPDENETREEIKYLMSLFAESTP